MQEFRLKLDLGVKPALIDLCQMSKQLNWFDVEM
jgi:hypothetical protein